MMKPVDNETAHAKPVRSGITVEARVVRIDAASATPPVGMDKDRRRSIRVPVDHGIRCHYGTGESGTTLLCDVGRGGVSARSRRYLRPGTRVLLEFDGRGMGAPEELKAEVSWCRPMRETGEFQTGLRVYHDDPRALGALAGLMFEGLNRLGANQGDWRGGGPAVVLKACITPVRPACQAG